MFIALLPFALALKSSSAPGGAPHWDYLTAPPHRAFSWLEFGAALIAVQWAYHGWTNLGPVGEEIREPQRNVPLALLGGIGILIYLTVDGYERAFTFASISAMRAVSSGATTVANNWPALTGDPRSTKTFSTKPATLA